MRRPPHPVPDVLAYLAGRWRVERTVRDLASGRTGAFHGEAVFAPDPAARFPGGSLLHHESGRFTWGDATRPAERWHRFEAAGDGTAQVRFRDGRPFHDLDLRTGRWTAHHPCAADAYRGEFTVLGPDDWQVEWTVTGPAKDLVLLTLHHRLSAEADAVPPAV